jgi:hypothetical protein
MRDLGHVGPKDLFVECQDFLIERLTNLPPSDALWCTTTHGKPREGTPEDGAQPVNQGSLAR